MRLATDTEIMAIGVRPMGYNVRRWVPKGGYTLITAETGVGKTWVASHMAICIGYGLACFGATTTQTRVLHVAAEGRKDEIGQRYHALYQAMEIIPSGQVIVVDEPVYIDTADGLRDLEETVRANGIGLVIIDPIVACCRNTAENDNNAVREMTEKLMTVLQRAGADAIITHHTGKGEHHGVYSGRGASDFGDGALSVITLSKSKTPGEARMQHVKSSRPNLYADPVTLTINVTMREEATADYIERASVTWQQGARGGDAALNSIVEAIRNAGKPLKPKEIGELTNVRGGTLNRALNKGVEDGLITKPRYGVYSV